MIDAKEMARLVRETDGDDEVTPSTVHYYTQLGILPPAVGRGRGAFSPEHLARFRLARQRRRDGRSLSEIREEMRGLTTSEVEGLMIASAPLLASRLSPPATAAPYRMRRLAAPIAALRAAPQTAPRTLRFRGGYALQVPAGVPDEMVARLYAAVERVLNRELSRWKKGGGKGASS